MKKSTLALLCCSAFLNACGSSDDAGSVMDAPEDSVSEAVSAVSSPKETAPKETAVSSVADTKDESTVVATTASDVVTPGGAGSAEQGEDIYKSKCSACHNTGVAGAPKVGDKAAWAARIAQGDALMVQHAIKGYKGDTGYMPPKGGFMNLSDEQISASVSYMVSQSQ